MKSDRDHSFESTILLHLGQTRWNYVLLPKDVADKIREHHAQRARKSKTVHVAVTIEAVTWNTQLFEDKKSGSYLLPLRAGDKHGPKVGDTVAVALTVLE